MKTTERTALFLSTLALLCVVEPVLAYYDPGVQRWIKRDPLGELGYELRHPAATAKTVVEWYVFVENEPVSTVDSFGLQRPPWISIIFPPTTTGNPFTCALVSRTEPVTGDPTPGSGNHNGESACIWRCNYFGDQVAVGPPSTQVTWAKPNNPCPVPKDPGSHRKCAVVPKYDPVFWGDTEYE